MLQTSIKNSVPPVFIGGTGRSGTSILGWAFASESSSVFYAEPRFLVDPGGVSDLLDGKITSNEFLTRMKTTFLPHIHKCVRPRDLDNTEEVFTEEVIDRLFNASFVNGSSLNKSTAMFTRNLLDHGVESWGKRFWVEKTPNTIVMAHKLYSLFPDMRYIHLIRDPKDVCCSTIEQKWGPQDIGQFILYYAKKMIPAFDVMRQIPKENYLVVSLENMAKEPGKTIERIIRFADVPFSENAMEKAAGILDPDRANIGRWMHELSADAAIEIDRLCNPVYELWRQVEKMREQ